MPMQRLRLFAFAGVLAGTALAVPSPAMGQQVFAGTLNNNLRAEAAEPGFTVLRHIPTPHIRVHRPLDSRNRRGRRPRPVRKVEVLGVAPLPGDQMFRGFLRLPRKDGLRYLTMLVRHADGESTLYVDSNRDGHFEPEEGVPLRPAEGDSDVRFEDEAVFRVDLPSGSFHTVEMRAWTLRAGGPRAIGGNRIRIAYTALTCVPGYARLPRGMLSMCFEYDPATGQASLADGLEWVNGNRILRPHGGAPDFRAAGLTLRAATLDVKTHAFVVTTVPDSAGRRD